MPRRLAVDDKMPFMEHLGELRTRIMRSLFWLLGGTFIALFRAEQITDYLARPVTKLGYKLVFTAPAEAFWVQMKVALIVGIFIASPGILWQVWAFIAPGLYRREKRYVVPFIISTVLLFCSGGLFGYKIVFPAALDFLISYSKQFQPMITIGEYTNLFLAIIIGMGLIFEMPILIFFLSLMGIVSAGWMWRNMRYSILVIFIIAAIVTPTTDILNMCIFAAPMIALYVVSIAIAWAFHPKQRKARREKQAK